MVSEMNVKNRKYKGVARTTDLSFRYLSICASRLCLLDSGVYNEILNYRWPCAALRYRPAFSDLIFFDAHFGCILINPVCNRGISCQNGPKQDVKKLVENEIQK